MGRSIKRRMSGRLEENQHERGLERNTRASATLDPYIGEPQPEAAASQRSGNVKLMFYGAQGLRAGWKVLLFAAIVITLFLATRPLINSVAPRSPGSVSPQIDLIREFWLALLVLVATSVMVRLERRPLRSYGFTDSAGLQRLCFGVCWGLLSISALVGALWVHGSLVFDGFPSANGHALPDA